MTNILISLWSHTLPVQHLLPFVAALSPQAHESAAALASIYFRMVIRRLWWDSPAVLKWFHFLDLNEVIDLARNWLRWGGLSWSIRDANEDLIKSGDAQSWSHHVMIDSPSHWQRYTNPAVQSVQGPVWARPWNHTQPPQFWQIYISKSIVGINMKINIRLSYSAGL